MAGGGWGDGGRAVGRRAGGVGVGRTGGCGPDRGYTRPGWQARYPGRAGPRVHQPGLAGPTTPGGSARGYTRPGWQAPLLRQALRASSRPIAGALRPTRLATARTGNPTEAFAKFLTDDQRVATTP
jgi:hypothetical protein